MLMVNFRPLAGGCWLFSKENASPISRIDS